MGTLQQNGVRDMARLAAAVRLEAGQTLFKQGDVGECALVRSDASVLTLRVMCVHAADAVYVVITGALEVRVTVTKDTNVEDMRKVSACWGAHMLGCHGG